MSKISLQFLFPLFLISGIILIGTNSSTAQYETELKLYRSTNDLDKKAALGLKLWNPLMRNNLDSLRKIAFELILRGVEERNDFAVAIGKRSLGSCFIRTGEPQRGIAFLKESLKYFKKTDDKILITETLNEIGNAFLYKGEPIKAEKYYLESLRAGKESPDPTSVFLAEINLGQAYIGLKNYDKASAVIQHYKNESLKHGKLESVSNAYALLGTIEQNRENIPLAMEYFEKSADFGKRSESRSQIAHAYNNMAIVYFNKGETGKTLEYFTKALEIRKKTGNAKYIAESYFNIGGLHYELGDYKKAEEYYKMSLDLARKKKLRKDEMDAILAITELYKEQNKHEKALTLMETYVELQDKYYSQLSIENSYSVELIESIKQMEADNMVQDRNSELKELEQSQNKMWYVVYSIGGITLLVLIILFFFKKKIN